MLFELGVQFAEQLQSVPGALDALTNVSVSTDSTGAPVAATLDVASSLSRAGIGGSAPHAVQVGDDHD